jgi:UDP-N-acetylglucosamine:LPS N-acetylglucosamine transferase
MKKVLFVASTGGHLNELLQLRKTIDKYDSYIITEKTKSTDGLVLEFGDRIKFFKYGSKSHLSYIYIFPYNCIKGIIYFIKVRPDVLVTTGAHTGAIMCYIAKLFRKKVIYIETFANIHSKTASGRLVYPIADIFVVQWKSMLELYPKAIYGGWIF